MRLDDFLQNLGRAFGEAMAQNGNFKFSGDSNPGLKLGELELEGAAPDALKVALHKGDLVRVTTGDKLAITVDGDSDATDSLRFRLDDDTLRILHPNRGGGDAIISVTMPAPRKLAIAGGGTIETDSVAGRAQIAIGGSGAIRIARVDGSELAARIGGSGTIAATGQVDNLSLAIGGSGRLDAKDLEVDHAQIRIGGSGKVVFSSDGEVDARIGGAGDILVYGAPRCSLKAGGAGKLRCEPRAKAEPVAEIDG